MEYRGVYTDSGIEAFRVGGFQEATNNIGEFLALVHGLALLAKTHSPLPIYSDSVTALAWVRNKHCKTQLPRTEANRALFELVARAEQWLRTHAYTTPVLKWDTRQWGEIPADFGRK
jgi:ribonuclease HI